MGSLNDRIRKLERGGTWFSPEPTSEWGVPAATVVEEWERVFGPLAGLVARAAQRIRERRANGESLDDLLRGPGGGVDLMALVASYDSFDAIPAPVLEALGASERRAGEGGMGERSAALIRDFHRIVISEAFEILDSEGRE